MTMSMSYWLRWRSSMPLPVFRCSLVPLVRLVSLETVLAQGRRLALG
jgi:hypothetical protein